MIRISGIKVKLGCDINKYLLLEVSRRLKVGTDMIKSVDISRKSVDARRKDNVHYVISVDVILSCDEEFALGRINDNAIKKVIKSSFEICKVKNKPALRPVVCGFGPAGMFCALMLARAGLEPIVIERGASVDERAVAVEGFFDTGKLSLNSNVQFGEGGAGTFSDGKLTCGLNDKRMDFILSQFVKFGASEDILYMAKPHIGTDVLRNVVKNLRKEVLSLGGKIYFNTRLDDIRLKNGRVCCVVCDTPKGELEIECDTLIMAIGHSARDTFELLYDKGALMVQKPFSMGVRIEHLRSMIDEAQYGRFSKYKELGAADYKLSCKVADARGVYTFCMCPGGSVVAAASEHEGVVTNGMSLHARDDINSNAAILCDVKTSDFESEHPLSGIEFQRKWEKKAYILGQRSYKAPVNLVGDFMDKKVATSFGAVLPTYRPGTVFAPLHECLPEFVSNAIRQALPVFDSRLCGFASRDAVLTGVETRSSSPVRIIRGEGYESNKVGIFPCGEGAGYAGGIMSAALDGIKVACEIIGRCNGD